MDSLLTRCTFCGTRHLIRIDDLDVWFVQCTCGACGFVEDEQELAESGHMGIGFTVHEVPNLVGTFVHLADPLPVFVNDRLCWAYVCWYRKEDRAYV